MPTKRVSTGKWRRYHNQTRLQRLLDVRTSALNVRDLVKLNIGVAQALTSLRRFKPDVVFVKGGYVGLPVGLAARLLRIPLVIHESDVVFGLSNRLLASRAQVIATGFPVSHYPAQWRAKLRFTGVPVRPNQFKVTRSQGREFFGYKPGDRVVLIFGGSLGAVAINSAVMANAGKLSSDYKIIHISGRGDFDRVKGWLKTQPEMVQNNYNLYSFLPKELGLAIAASDTVVARAGMSSVTEVAAAQRPLIVVPGPQLGDQPKNAATLKKLGAAIVVDQAKLERELTPAIKRLFANPDQAQRLASSLGKLAKPGAAQAVADLILEAAA